MSTPAIPATAEGRNFIIQDRIGKLMRADANLSYSAAWQTVNAAADLKPLFDAMKKPASEPEDAIIDALMVHFTQGMIGAGFMALDLCAGSLKIPASTKQAICASPLFAELNEFTKNPTGLATANAAATARAAAGSSFREMCGENAVQLVRAMLDGAVSYADQFLSKGDASREVYAHPLFAPLVDYVEGATGEKLATANGAPTPVADRANARQNFISTEAMKHFLHHAIATRGLSVVRALLAKIPDIAPLVLPHLSTANAGPIMDTKAAGAKFVGLVQAAQKARGCTYDQAWQAMKIEEPKLWQQIVGGDPAEAYKATPLEKKLLANFEEKSGAVA